MARSIVIWGGPPYFGPANSPQEEMARAFRGLGCDVLYLELEGDGGHFRKESRMNPGPIRGTAGSGEGVLVARIPKLPLAPYAMVGALLGAHVGMAVRQLRWLEPIWQDNSATLILYGWFGAGLVNAFAGTRSVYDCIDEHRAADGVEGNAARVAHVWETEKRLLGAADLTVCVSETLAEERAGVAKRLAVLPNGADVEWCRGQFKEPASVVGLPRPRALFLGRITSKIDLALLREAAAADTSVPWVLAGEPCGIQLGEMPPNVHALGLVHHDDMAPLAAYCDCGVAPLASSAWNRASSPMKFGDYLAAGLPIVSTPVPAADALAKELPGAVLTADGPQEFARAVSRAAALGEEARARCRAHAHAHTWKGRAESLLGELDRSGGGS